MATSKSKSKSDSDGKVEITLAHPLTREQDMLTLGLDVREEGYGVEETIRVHPQHASTLIGAGYAADIDPENHEAVQAALGGESPVAEPARGAASNDGSDK